MKKSSIVFLILFFLLIPGSAWAEDSPLAVYRAPDGIEIRSFSPKWTQEQLKEVHLELLRNFHSKEISFLSHVNIYPHDPGIAGHYYSKYYWDSRGNRSYDQDRYIDIYDGNKKTSAAQIADVLAHEYGHHFTYYYLWIKEGITFQGKTEFPSWRKSGYAKIRGLANDNRVSSDGANHSWRIAEIAAEDYVQLFGSPNAKKSATFLDYNQRIAQAIYSFRYSSEMYNLVPQENLDLPLAAEILGLEEYWRKLAGVAVTKLNQPPGKPTVVLTQVDNPEGRKQLVFKWTPVLDDGAEPLEYTLITYRDGEILPEPVKTVLEGETLVASYDLGKALTGWRNFRVYVKDRQGKLVSSKVLRVNLDQPQIGQLLDVVIFKDVNLAHWAYKDIKELWELKIVQGYQGRVFHPQGNISKGEFLALAMRLAPQLPLGELSLLANPNHWAAPFLAKAAVNSVVSATYYGDRYVGFKYDDPITREEMAMISARLVSGLLTPGEQSFNPRFIDIQASRYPEEIAKATALGIINGYPEDNSFRPLALATRAEAARIIFRVMGLLKQ